MRRFVILVLLLAGSCWAQESGNLVPATTGVGTQEPERMRAGLHRLHAALDEARIKHVFFESPGTDHEWQTWRRSLKDFAPRLF